PPRHLPRPSPDSATPPYISPLTLALRHAHLRPRPHLPLPTRRSSDLLAADRVANGQEIVDLIGRGAVGRARVNVDVHTALVDDSDRKSTRLNSSHGSIAYAVFCLEKNR